MGPQTARWWQSGIIYQVYPLSFMDANGDGKGDLAGITAKLDYLARLGVAGIWISPFFTSPMADFGYDVSDYEGINPVFGDLSDFDALVAGAHSRGLKIILDLVPNHTSSAHPWFIASRSSREDPKRDWYLWHDPLPGGEPPNNWRSVFGGSGWEWDAGTNQYYFHSFLREQPDLNWRNPAVRNAIFNVMRFWLDRGADGFRVDVMWHLVKDRLLRDNPPDPAWREGMLDYRRVIPLYSTDQAETHDIVIAMRRVTDGYPDRVILGEIYLPVTELINYYEKGAGAHLPLNFALITNPWDAAALWTAINRYEASLPEYAWPNWVIGNHDKPRIASRVGTAQAKIAAILLLTLRGTPTLYYGDELGMRDLAVAKRDALDPTEEPRDPERSPMQWDDTPHAGFTDGDPWLPVNDDYATINVAREQEDPASMLGLYRELLALRRNEPALALGRFLPVGIAGDAFAYLREDEETGRRFLVAVNLGSGPRAITLPPRYRIRALVLAGTHPARAGARIETVIDLAGDEGIVALVG